MDVITVSEAGKILNIPTREVLDLVDDGPLEPVFIEHNDGGLRVKREQVDELATGMTPLWVLTDIDAMKDYRFWSSTAASVAVPGRVGVGHAWEIRKIVGKIGAGGTLVASGINT